MSAPVIVAFGGGVDSTGMLVELVRRKEPVDAVLFADTGGEKPRTYQHVSVFSEWLVEQKYPAVTIVRHTRRDGSAETLEGELLRLGNLPSIAYGRKKCSQKYKREPQDKWANHWEPAQAAWSAGLRPVKLLGFDIDERHRATPQDDDKKFKYRYPLIEWRWGRDECVAAIESAGLCVPPKSACFFCPSSKAHEIVSLPENLKARALEIERGAMPGLTDIAGLGRNFSWAAVMRADRDQLKMFPPPPDECSRCWDGDEPTPQRSTTEKP